ncbi:hypothetical protein Aduo_012119 [Ancylostoma duodenale]
MRQITSGDYQSVATPAFSAQQWRKLRLRCLRCDIRPALCTLAGPEPVEQWPIRGRGCSAGVAEQQQPRAPARRSIALAPGHRSCILPTSRVPGDLLEHGLTRIELLSVDRAWLATIAQLQYVAADLPRAASSLLPRSRLDTSSSAPLA